MEKIPVQPLQERVAVAIPEYRALLNTISRTEHAPSSLVQARNDLMALRRKIFTAREAFKSAEAGAQLERDEWIKAKGNHMRKIFKREKFNEQVRKEESEYAAASELERRASAALKILTVQEGPLLDKKDALLKPAEEYKDALMKLQDLYEAVFDGPTPDNPEEDRMEASFRAVQAECNSIQILLSNSSKARDVLAMVLGLTKSALDRVKEVLGEKGPDVIDSDGSRIKHGMVGLLLFDDVGVVEGGNELERMKENLANADYYLATARELDPSVGHFALPAVAAVDFAVGTGQLERLICTPITDFLQHTEIGDTHDALIEVINIITADMDRLEEKLVTLAAERDPLYEKVKSQRDELLDFRVKTFKQLVENLKDNKTI